MENALGNTTENGKQGKCCGRSGKCGARCAKIGVVVVLGIAVLGAVVMGLWNALLPNLFAGVKEISYLQALGVLLLSKILFGNFGRGCHSRRHMHQRRQMAALAAMTPEEREKFKAGLSGKCCDNKDGKSCC